MDFDTLKKLLNDGKFPTYEDFFQELQLIWDNCKLYNRADSEIHKLAEKMEKMAKRELQKFRSNYGLHALVLPSERRISKRTNNSKGEKGASDEAPGGSIANGGAGENGQSVPDGPTKQDIVTREMKLEFVSKIKKLTN